MTSLLMQTGRDVSNRRNAAMCYCLSSDLFALQDRVWHSDCTELKLKLACVPLLTVRSTFSKREQSKHV